MPIFGRSDSLNGPQTRWSYLCTWYISTMAKWLKVGSTDFKTSFKDYIVRWGYNKIF